MLELNTEISFAIHPSPIPSHVDSGHTAPFPPGAELLLWTKSEEHESRPECKSTSSDKRNHFINATKLPLKKNTGLTAVSPNLKIHHF